jgi:hypothetical protein
MLHKIYTNFEWHSLTSVILRAANWAYQTGKSMYEQGMEGAGKLLFQRTAIPRSAHIAMRLHSFIVASK